MTTRMPSHQRREQIVIATLALLASLPVDRITTRAIAERVGISQPALFRHFSSREQIFQAVVDHARTLLKTQAQEALAAEDWEESVLAIARVFSGLVSTYPGLPRLFFYDLATSSGATGTSLKSLISTQAALVASLISDAQQRKELPQSLDAAEAGRLFLVAMQGSVALSTIDDPVTTESAVQMWIASARAGVPRRVVPAQQPEKKALIHLDVRPLLAAGTEPLPQILQCVQALAEDGLLLIIAPFRATPLLTLLKSKGLWVQSLEVDDHFEITVRGAHCPPVLYTLDMEAPEPLEAVLLATGTEEVVVAWVPQVPTLLFTHLKRRGLSYEVLELWDRTALIHIARRTP